MRHTLFIICCLFVVFTNAQTWNGNTSTDWNTPTNWSGGAVPLPAGNVTIPTAPAGNRWPKLAGNVSINGLTMQAGAQLDVNGFTVTVNGVGSSRVDLQACKLEYSIVSPK